MNTAYPTLNFGLGEEIDMLRQHVYHFAKSEIAPLAEHADTSNQFPNALWPKLGEMGLLGVTVSEQYGGADMGYLAHTGGHGRSESSLCWYRLKLRCPFKFVRKPDF